ncbi:MAG: glutaredoxin 3 [Legionellales bacterium]|jgi:glutaredoxin 3|nr:glutaredoxin 3 [Legionellales bacterium]
MKPAVVIYSSAICPYCDRAKLLLKKKNIAFTEIRVDEHPEKRIEMQNKSERQSVPQIFIGDHHVGGCDDLYALEAAGQLDPLLNNA